MSRPSSSAAQDFARLAKGPVGRIVAATIAAGMLSGYWTVSSMKEQAPPPSPFVAVQPAEADPRVEPAAYDLFGAVAPDEAGYRWAEMARIRRIEQCPDASPIFRSGCVRYLTAAEQAQVRVVRAEQAPVVEVVPVVAPEVPAVEDEEEPVFTEDQTY